MYFLTIQSLAFAEFSKDSVYQFEIESQALSGAIEKLKKITQIEVIYFSEVIQNVQSTKISGDYTAQQALKILLKGTDLQIAELSQLGSFVIKGKNLDNNAKLEKNLAQYNQTKPVNQSNSDDSVFMLETIAVTGSRIRATNIVSPIPTTTIGSIAIQAYGSVDLGEIIEQIPGVYQGISPSNSLLDNQDSGLSTIDLRALGTNRTLTLINGRRVISSSASAQRVDTSTIPSGFIDYIDITTGGASAAYGSDAIAGVANIVLKDDFVGFDLSARYADSHDGGRQANSVDATWGTDFDGSRGNLMLGLNWESKNALFADDRFYSLNNNQIDLETGELHPDHIRSSSGGRFENGDAWNTDGMWNNNQEESIYCFMDAENECHSFDEEIDGFDFRPFATTVPERDRISLMVNSRYDFTDTLSGSFLLHYSESDNNVTRAPAVGGSRLLIGLIGNQTQIGDISPDHPFIHPAIQEIQEGSINWSRVFTEVGVRNILSNRKTTRATFTLDGQINHNWGWNAYAGIGEFKHHQDKNNEVNFQNIQYALNIEDDPTNPGGYRCINAQARANGCAPLNIFGINSISSAAADYIRHTISLDQKLTQTTASFLVYGDLWNLPVGPVKSVFGIDYKRDTQQAKGDELSNAGLTSSSSLSTINTGLNVTEAFVELNMPLIADMPGIKSLDATAALRLANYSTIGQVSSWNVGLSYAINPNFRLRTQISQAQRAPDITELFSLFRSNTIDFIDPCDGVEADTEGVIAQNCRSDENIARVIDDLGIYEQDAIDIFSPTLGNSELFEETADTFTFGFVYNPMDYPDFSITADYYKITVEDAIGVLDNQLVADLCYSDAETFATNRFCNIITRDLEGEVSRIINQFENINSLVAQGIDVTLNYGFNVPNIPGRFDANIFYTYIIKNEEDFVGTIADVTHDFVGEVGLPKNEYRVKLNWKNQNNTLAYTMRYSGSVKDNNNPSPDDVFGFVTFESVMLHNIYYSHQFENTHPIRIYAGINNITNQNGPYLPFGYNSGSKFNVNPNYDRIGRRYYMGFDYSW